MEEGMRQEIHPPQLEEDQVFKLEIQQPLLDREEQRQIREQELQILL